MPLFQKIPEAVAQCIEIAKEENTDLKVVGKRFEVFEKWKTELATLYSSFIRLWTRIDEIKLVQRETKSVPPS